MITNELQELLLGKLRDTRAQLDQYPHATDLDKLRIDSLVRLVEKNESDELLLELLQAFADDLPEASEPDDFRVVVNSIDRQVRVADRYEGKAGQFLDLFFHLRSLDELQEVYDKLLLKLLLCDRHTSLEKSYEYVDFFADALDVMITLKFPGQKTDLRFFRTDTFMHVLEQYLDAWEEL